eukprot:scaffold4970_cov161-Prasinococcus_capsulatus_cf.AAC.1
MRQPKQAPAPLGQEGGAAGAPPAQSNSQRVPCRNEFRNDIHAHGIRVPGTRCSAPRAGTPNP